MHFKFQYLFIQLRFIIILIFILFFTPNSFQILAIYYTNNFVSTSFCAFTISFSWCFFFDFSSTIFPFSTIGLVVRNGNIILKSTLLGLFNFWLGQVWAIVCWLEIWRAPQFHVHYPPIFTCPVKFDCFLSLSHSLFRLFTYQLFSWSEAPSRLAVDLDFFRWMLVIF